MCLPSAGYVTSVVWSVLVSTNQTTLLTNRYVTTFAGVPLEPGFADGYGAQVKFTLPCGLAADKQGRVVLADSGNHVIRLIQKDGYVCLCVRECVRERERVCV